MYIIIDFNGFSLLALCLSSIAVTMYDLCFSFHVFCLFTLREHEGLFGPRPSMLYVHTGLRFVCKLGEIISST